MAQAHVPLCYRSASPVCSNAVTPDCIESIHIVTLNAAALENQITDPRESGATDGADVKQCRTFDAVSGTWSGDLCPHDGGLDQNIYGTRIQ